MQWFSNRPIKQKLLLVILTGFGVFAILNTFIYRTLIKTQSSAISVARTQTVVEIADEMLASLYDMNSAYRGYLIGGEESFLTTFNQEKDGYQKRLTELKELTKDDADLTKRWTDLDNWAGAWQANVTSKGILMRHMVNDKKLGPEIIARFESSGIGQQHFDQIITILSAAIADQKTVMNQRSELSALDNATMRSIMLWGTVLAFTMAIPMLLIVGNSIARPMKEMTGIASALALGDVSREVTHHSKDEIGVLAESFRGMTVYIRTIATACESLGQGDISVSINPRSEKDIIAKSFTHAVNSVRETISEMAHSASSLSAASNKLSETSAEMRGNAERTAAEAGSVSTAADQISSNIQTVVQGAENMTASIREISTNAREAAQVASNGVIIAKEAILKVGKLGESSQEIGNVIKVITSIAGQTHLLALNATIEAARAGEAGKGFAVVANEVKELARETAKATEDISRKIETIQSDTKGAIEGINQVGQIIAQINDIQNIIATAVEEQTATTNEITRNVSDVASGNQKIASNILEVSQAAQSTTQGAEFTNKAALELAHLASTLQSLVEQFDRGATDADSLSSEESDENHPVDDHRTHDSDARGAQFAAAFDSQEELAPVLD
jgi:methyl-accepting chemotaxis protein